MQSVVAPKVILSSSASKDLMIWGSVRYTNLSLSGRWSCLKQEKGDFIGAPKMSSGSKAPHVVGLLHRRYLRKVKKQGSDRGTE